MPPTVAVVTDSTSYLPPELIDRWGICEINLHVGWEQVRAVGGKF